MIVLMIVATLSVLIAKLLFHITVGPHFFKNLISYGVSSFAPLSTCPRNGIVSG